MSVDPGPVDMRLVAKAYRDRGWAPVPLKADSKAPIHEKWPELVTDDQTAFPGNIGIKLGEPGGGLVDIDLDWEESRLLAPAVMPETDARFGRASAPGGHRLYRCDKVPASKPFLWSVKGDDGKLRNKPILEIRSTGGQTMFPPSVHPEGERVAWESSGPPRTIADAELNRAAAITASAALVLRHWPKEGARFHAWGALIGTLLRCGVGVEVVGAIVEVIAAKHNPGKAKKRRSEAVAAMRRKLDGDRGMGVPGFPRLKEVFGDEVAKRVKRWLRQKTHGAGNYRIIDGALHYLKVDNLGTEIPVKLTNFRAEITEDQIIDDGAAETRRYQIEGALERGQELPTITLPVKDFAGAGWVDRHWGARAIVNVGAGQAMFGTAIKYVSGEVPERRIFGHLGWRQIDGRWVYLHAGGAIGAEGVVDGIEVEVSGELAHFVLPPPPHDLQRQIQIALKMFELNAATAAAVWRAPLCEFCPATFSLYIAGRTGVFKSALLGVAQAHWGAHWDGVRFPANWRGTVNSIEKLAFTAKDALLVVDDFAPGNNRRATDELHQKAEGLLRGQGNLAGRSRMNCDTSMRPTYYPRGVIAASGEDVPAGQSLRARMMIEQLGPGGIDPERLSELQKAAAGGLLAEAMAGYVQWFAAAADAGAIKGELQEWQAENRTKVGAEHRRTSDVIASLMLGAAAFLNFAVHVGAIDQNEQQTHLDAIWKTLNAGSGEQAAEQTAEDPIRLFVEAIPALLAAGEAHLADREGNAPQSDPAALGWRKRSSSILEEIDGGVREVGGTWQPQHGCIGWIEGDDLWILPDPAIAAVNRLLSSQGKSMTLQRNTLGRRLKDDQWLTEWSGDGFTKVVKVGGALRVLAMRTADVLGLVTGP